jgi:aspartate carbamoyltransferase catalytic subunit
MNSRTVRSLTYFLAKYSGIKISFLSPRVLQMKDDIKDYLAKHQVPYSESCDNQDEMEAVARNADILYITQIPRDHFGDRLDDYDEAARIFRIDETLLTVLKKDACIMHPLPRGQEVAAEVDDDPRAMYFRQIQYGQFVRMSLLCHVLGAEIG